MSYLMVGFVSWSFSTHLSPAFFGMFGDLYVSLVQGACVLFVFFGLSVLPALLLLLL